jgi:hypothetical protein
MTLRHMTRVKIIKDDKGHLYIIPFDMTETFIYLRKFVREGVSQEVAEKQFYDKFSDYRYDHINDAELYIKQSFLYP